jgi:hypothetical protein
MANPNLDNYPEEVQDSPEDGGYSPMMPKEHNAMDKDNDGETPCRVTRRSTKCTMVVSLTQEQPPAQCVKIAHHRVRHITVHFNPEH